MYDLCLNKHIITSLDMSDLLKEIPILADSAFLQKLFLPSTTPGALGLELPRNLAKRLLERFMASGSDGYGFPAAYHYPHLTIKQATVIAAQAIEKRRLERGPTDLFRKRRDSEWHPGAEGGERHVAEERTADVVDAMFRSNHTYPCFWSFGAISEPMMPETDLPNVIFVCVDKLDGHVWQQEELRRLSGGAII